MQAKPVKYQRKEDKKMKKFKKVLAAVLAMSMVLGMSVTSMAASKGDDDKFGTSDDRGTIKVSGIDWSENITATAYKIIEAKYENDVFVGYEFVEGIDAGNMKLENDAHEPINLTDEDLDLKEISKIAEYCKQNETKLETKTVTTANTAGEAEFNDLKVGTYLILIDGAELKIYNPIVASIYYTGTGTGNDMNEANFDITEDHAWTKIASAPNVDKVIVVGTDSNVKGNSENIGDEVEYKVTVSPIPNYGGEYPVFKIKDTLSGGLDYVDGSLSVTVNDKPFTDYTPSISGREISVDFVKDGVYTLDKNVGETLVISYKARLNEDAQVNQLGNKNDVVLTYSRNSAIEGNVATDSDVTYTHTFDIDGNVTGAETTNIITKKNGIASDSNATVLPGAEFTLYTDKDTKTPYNRVLTEGRTEKGLVVSDAKGQLTITGLEEGTYYLKETKAPDSYSLNTHVFKIEIKDVVLNNDGTLKSWKISIDGADTASFAVDQGVLSKTINGVVVPNTKISTLPSTGGIGTTIFTLGGCAIMIIAAGLYFASRRKKTEK